MPDPRQYELIYILAPDVDDAGVAELHTRVEEIVAAGGGRIDKTDNWGRRRLAYEIDRHKEGTYVLELFTGTGAIVAELDRRLKVSDNILRYLIVRVDEDLRKAEHVRARRQAKRRQPRGGAAPPPEGAAAGETGPAAAAGETAASDETPPPAAEAGAAGEKPAAETEQASGGRPAAEENE